MRQYKLALYNKETESREIGESTIIDQSVLNWLERHEIGYSQEGQKYYKVNSLYYINLGEYKLMDYDKS